MTMVNLPAPVALSPYGGAIPVGDMGTGVGSAGTFVFNGAGDKLAIIFIARTNAVPDLISFYVTAATAGTTGVIEATLETVSAGDPAGAVTNSATGTATVTTTGAKTISGMDGTATITPGNTYAIVLTAGSGWDRSITIKISDGTTAGTQNFPVIKTKDSAGAWAVSTGTNLGFAFGIADATPTYLQIPGLFGAYIGTTQSYGSGTNPDERGNRFILSAPMRLCGVMAMYSSGAPGANDDVKFKLLTSHTSSPVEQISVTLEGEAQGGDLSHIIMFGSTYNCDAGTIYAITMEALGTDTQAMIRWEYPSNGALGGILGTDFYSTTRNDLGNCTDGNTMIYALFPIFDQIDDGTGSGGGGGSETAHGVVGLQSLESGVIA